MTPKPASRVNDALASAAARQRRRLRRLLGDPAATPWAVMAREAVRHEPGLRTERWTLRHPDGMAVRAWAAGPAGPWRGRPGVLHIHAHGNRHGIGAAELVEGRPSLADPPPAISYAAAGLVALSLDLPGFGSRQTADDGVAGESALAKAALWRGRPLFGTMVGDLAGALALLRALVGRAPVAVAGLSMGATLAFWLGALDVRVRAVVHLLAFADLVTLVAAGAHDRHGPYMTVPGLLPVATTGGLAGLIAPRPQWLLVDDNDPLTPPEALDRGLADLRAAYDAHAAAAALHIHRRAGPGHRETAADRSLWIRWLAETLAATTRGEAP